MDVVVVEVVAGNNEDFEDILVTTEIISSLSIVWVPSVDWILFKSATSPCLRVCVCVCVHVSACAAFLVYKF